MLPPDSSYRLALHACHDHHFFLRSAADAYAVGYSALLLHDNQSLPFITVSGADWTFTRLICLKGGPGRGWGWKHWPPVLAPWCRLYDSADYTIFILLKMRFFAGYRHLQVIHVCRVSLYARKYGRVKLALGDHPFVKLKVIIKNRWLLNEGSLTGAGIVVTIVSVWLTSWVNYNRPILS